MSAFPALLLGGRVVLVTRPAGQAEALCRAVQALGGEALALPTIAIEALPQAAQRVAEAAAAGMEVAVFTSGNAARIAWPLLRAAGATPAYVAAVGEGTAAALREAGCAVAVQVPERADSEGLLALPMLEQVAARRVVIFTGEQGRDVLSASLQGRGALVRVTAVYRRALPAAPKAEVVARLRAGAVHAVTVSSAEGGRNLYALLPADAGRAVALLPHVVPHPRIAQALRQEGAVTVLVAPGGDGALAAALAGFFAGARAADGA
ncbi:MAG: uroporphyrinogen-III synthase [Betaproteobacteria bacterium]|nr:uroporphyrinogen-III synthase [Rhodocyclaceae bacterium]MCA3133989.1 uroporphyrinogen-III synthase [Rhodocyclaceae bacterium]MCA3141744.1 uroporphyrinogen-III synthase [Rhodocyclaceae bacterium]MCA3146043.1 uroporphyrinogen-III synthase [Rhodocyclaceae bacterium]MCE2896886.1 uroporphyrinogen-III synthase [Betaproteobacteria bacterium]